jgi:hypothetical protein
VGKDATSQNDQPRLDAGMPLTDIAREAAGVVDDDQPPEAAEPDVRPGEKRCVG